MLLQNGGTLLELSCTEQLVHFPVHGNQGAGIVVAAVHQHHADAKFSECIPVKAVQPLASMEANQEAVKVEIMVDRARPVPCVDRLFVLFHRSTNFFQQIGVGTVGREDGGQLQHPPELIDLMHIAQCELRNCDSTMKIAPEQALDREN